jgi:endonuclease/exonuclease/phosphatase family metal-dependent hydrolase
LNIRASLLALWAVTIFVGSCSSPSGDSPDAAAIDADGDQGSPDQYVAPDIQLGPPVTLTLATFNVKNFFDAVDDPSHEDDVPSPTTVSAKVKAVGLALREIGADVLALEEVENIGLINRVNSEELQSLGYAHVRLVPGNDIRGINVALLSRYPIPKAVSHKGDRFPGVDGDTTTYGFSRDCLEATVEASPGRTLVLLVNHLRATDSTQESVSRRLAQAAQVRKIADGTLQLKPEANLAVIGDLNDTPGSKTLDLIVGGTPSLSDVTASVPAADRYTYVYSGTKEQIDYILTAPGLQADLVTGTATVNHSTTFKAASDHYPVRARFTLK